MSIQGNLAAAKEQDLEPLSRDGKVAEGSLGKDAVRCSAAEKGANPATVVPGASGLAVP